MLIIISDIHLMDGTCGKSISGVGLLGSFLTG